MLALCMAMIDEPNDKEKFTEIYNTYKDMMFRTAMSVLHNDSLANETVQDCFLKIAMIISDIPNSGTNKLKALIIIMVRNKSLNNLKSEHYDRTEPLGETETISDDVLSRIISDIGYKKLVQEISALDDIYRDILSLRLLYDYSFDEIALLLDLPKGTVGTRIHRGKMILKKKLEGSYYE